VIVDQAVTIVVDIIAVGIVACRAAIDTRCRHAPVRTVRGPVVHACTYAAADLPRFKIVVGHPVAIVVYSIAGRVHRWVLADRA
jgi:hypothetical protein